MEKIKKAVGEQLEDTEVAVVEALNSRKIKLYIATLNALTETRKQLLNQISSCEIDKDVRRKFVILKKGKEALEEQPEVKTYLAILSKHAELSDMYRALETTEFSRK